MSTMYRANFGDLMQTVNVLNDVLFDEYNSYPEEYSKIFNIKSSSKKSETDSGVSTLGAMPSMTDADSFYIDNAIQGYDVTYTHVDYGMGYRVHQNLIDDDQYGVIERLPRALAKSANHTVEQTAANIFNNGFTSGTGGDGQYLFSASHPLTGGGTYSNTTASDLSITSLQAAATSMELVKDDRGLFLNIKPKLLVVPPALRFTADKLLNSMLESGTANNDKNTLKELGLTYMVNHYLTDTNAWFLLGDKSDHNLKFFWRMKLQTGVELEPLSVSAVHYGRMRFSVKWSDWRGTYGSSGST